MDSTIVYTKYLLGSISIDFYSNGYFLLNRHGIDYYVSSTMSKLVNGSCKNHFETEDEAFKFLNSFQ